MTSEESILSMIGRLKALGVTYFKCDSFECHLSLHEDLGQLIPTFDEPEEEVAPREEQAYWKGYKASDLGLSGG